MLAPAALLMAPFPEPPEEPKEQDEEPSKGRELPLLQDSEEQCSQSHITLFLAPLLHLVHQLSHVLTQLLCVLLHVLLHIHIHMAIHLPQPLGDARKIISNMACRRCVPHSPMAKATVKQRYQLLALMSGSPPNPTSVLSQAPEPHHSIPSRLASHLLTPLTSKLDLL